MKALSELNQSNALIIITLDYWQGVMMEKMPAPLQQRIPWVQ